MLFEMRGYWYGTHSKFCFRYLVCCMFWISTIMVYAGQRYDLKRIWDSNCYRDAYVKDKLTVQPPFSVSLSACAWDIEMWSFACVFVLYVLIDESSRIPSDTQAGMEHMREGWHIDGVPFCFFWVYKFMCYLAFTSSLGMTLFAEGESNGGIIG